MANIGPTLSKYVGASELSNLLESDKFGIYAADTYLALDGVTDDYSALYALINTTINGDDAEIWFKNGSCSIGSNITIPENIKLVFLNGGMLKPSSGITITGADAKIEAGIHQIFDLTAGGALAGTWQTEEIYPDWFHVTDEKEMIETAIEFALSSGNYKVAFPRLYDITGLGTIVITKPESNRRLLYLIGRGGGIQKDDSGYMMECSTYSNAGDIVSSNMHYKSTTSAGACVWNGNKVIRLTSDNDSYVNCDGVIKAIEAGKYFQTLRFNKCTITGGEGYAFECEHLYDVVISENIVENRESFFGNNFTLKDPTHDTVDNVVLRIVDNLVEGITGTFISLGSCYATKISGNYSEEVNGIIIDCSNSLNSVPHRGLEISNNGLERDSAQISAQTPCIDWGVIGDACVSFGNSTRGTLHTIDTTSSHKLIELGDNAFYERSFTTANKRFGLKIPDLIDGCQQLTNVALDGKFDVASFWAGENGANTAANNVLTSTGDGTNARVRTWQLYAYGSSPASKQFYLQSKIKVTNASCLDVYVELRSTITGTKSATIQTVSGPVQDTEYDIYGIATLPADWDTNNIYIYIYHRYADAATSSGKVMEIYPITFVDLTTQFGAGNEPTKELLYDIIDNDFGAYVHDSAFIPKTALDVGNRWKAWTPTLTWTTADPASITTVARYTTIGNTCFFNFMCTSADGNDASQLSISLPVTAKDNNSLISFSAQELVNATWTNPLAYLDDDSGGITFRSFSTATNAQTVTVIVSGQYEI